jgi:hypothetical protein
LRRRQLLGRNDSGEVLALQRDELDQGRQRQQAGDQGLGSTMPRPKDDTLGPGAGLANPESVRQPASALFEDPGREAQERKTWEPMKVTAPTRNRPQPVR